MMLDRIIKASNPFISAVNAFEWLELRAGLIYTTLRQSNPVDLHPTFCGRLMSSYSQSIIIKQTGYTLSIVIDLQILFLTQALCSIAEQLLVGLSNRVKSQYYNPYLHLLNAFTPSLSL